MEVTFSPNKKIRWPGIIPHVKCEIIFPRTFGPLSGDIRVVYRSVRDKMEIVLNVRRINRIVGFGIDYIGYKIDVSLASIKLRDLIGSICESTIPSNFLDKTKM